MAVTALIVGVSVMLLVDSFERRRDTPSLPEVDPAPEGSRVAPRLETARRAGKPVAERVTSDRSRVVPEERTGPAPHEFRPDPRRDIGLQVCDYWLARYDSPEGQRMASASVPRVEVDEAERSAELNPRRLTLTDTEKAELARLLASEDQAMNAASLRWKKAEWIAVKQKILTGRYIEAEGGKPAADAWAQAEQDAIRAYGAGNFCLSCGPGATRDSVRVYVLARGEPHAYLESLDEVNAVEQKRRRIIKQFFEALRR